MTKLKILMVCPDWFPLSSGLSESCSQLCYQMQNVGHKVKVIVAGDPNIDSKGLNVIPIPYLTRLIGKNPIVFNYWNKIKHYIKWCDRVCLFSYMYEMNSRIVLYKKLKLFNKPIIHFYRGSLENDVLKHLNVITRISKIGYDYTLARLMFKHVDKVISNSKPTLNLIQSKYKTDITKLHYVPNSVNVNDFKVSKLNNKRVIFVGRLVDLKGIKYLPDIIKVIPDDWKFTIVDKGPMMDFVKRLNHPNLEIKGKIPHSELIKLLSKSDINVLPSLSEGSPRSVIEANASGVPSIAFNVGDVTNIIQDKQYCIDFNIKQFCIKLKELINDDKLRKIMGNKARQLACNKLDWKITYPQIEVLL